MNMYVSNLATNTSEDDLKKLFDGYGAVSSAKVITDRYTGLSRGFGFVEMQSDAEAKNAMTELNGKEVSGKEISVTVAREKEDRPAKRKW